MMDRLLSHTVFRNDDGNFIIKEKRNDKKYCVVFALISLLSFVSCVNERADDTTKSLNATEAVTAVYLLSGEPDIQSGEIEGSSVEDTDVDTKPTEKQVPQITDVTDYRTEKPTEPLVKTTKVAKIENDIQKAPTEIVNQDNSWICDYFWIEYTQFKNVFIHVFTREKGFNITNCAYSYAITPDTIEDGTYKEKSKMLLY